MRGPDHASMLELSFASAEAPLSVRSFTALERASDLFECDVQAVSDRSSLDLAELVGSAAELRVSHALSISGRSAGRVFRGVCTHAEQVRVEPDGVSTLPPPHRARALAARSAPTTASSSAWRSRRSSARCSTSGACPRVALRHELVSEARLPGQCGETDYAFVSRLLERWASRSCSRRVTRDQGRVRRRAGGLLQPLGDAAFRRPSERSDGARPSSPGSASPKFCGQRDGLEDHDLRRPAFELGREATTRRAAKTGWSSGACAQRVPPHPGRRRRRHADRR
ncbi:MAG: hypothetical protein IPG04_41800 [Polyangiaceae bacterium]|nr:hypothetical protein [Polyangiaceae bacterium]